MPLITKSLREYLQGNLVDFSDSCGMSNLVTATTLTSLVVILADLREEGAVLIPEVYICENLDETLKLLPVKEILPIGVQDSPSEAIAQAIKKCSPLAIEGWCIYITQGYEKYQFGLFRASLNPLSISVDQTLFSEPRETIRLVRLFRTASGCVELCNHKGDIYSMLLSDKPATSPLPQAYTSNLVKLVCKDLNYPFKESTETYLEKTIRAALNSCHGAIIAVAKTKKIPRFLSDGVVLKVPLDIVSSVSKLLAKDADNTAEHALNANAALIKGMISSDGITVFNTLGFLIAYNCFIASPSKVSGKVVIGGARTRAYEALKAKVGKGLEGVFIQSQDGWTKFTGINDGQ
ncbi:MAG: hypothetical protein IPN53_23225 [Comamonadaceae bacterium]|nr:hypothetical protein [Comamonadaceae bacterium]